MPEEQLFFNEPLLPRSVHAGFPSPGDDYAESPLNLHDLVVQHPQATYYLRIKGDSMRGACIRTGDVVVVDRALTAGNNKVRFNNPSAL